MAFPAFLDTCVLFPIRLADVLLRLPDYGHSYRPLWSAHVLDELERNLVKKLGGMTPEKAARRIHAMRRHFPDAEVTGYEGLIPAMRCHENDRHVLAAAVAGEAGVIVTFNLKDFPAEALRPHEVEAVSPDKFLLDQLDLYPDATVRAVVQAALDRQRPAESVAYFVARLGHLVPDFARAVQELLAG